MCFSLVRIWWPKNHQKMSSCTNIVKLFTNQSSTNTDELPLSNYFPGTQNFSYLFGNQHSEWRKKDWREVRITKVFLLIVMDVKSPFLGSDVSNSANINIKLSQQIKLFSLPCVLDTFSIPRTLLLHDLGMSLFPVFYITCSGEWHLSLPHLKRSHVSGKKIYLLAAFISFPSDICAQDSRSQGNVPCSAVWRKADCVM